MGVGDTTGVGEGGGGLTTGEGEIWGVGFGDAELEVPLGEGESVLVVFVPPIAGEAEGVSETVFSAPTGVWLGLTCAVGLDSFKICATAESESAVLVGNHFWIVYIPAVPDNIRSRTIMITDR